MNIIYKIIFFLIGVGISLGFGYEKQEQNLSGTFDIPTPVALFETSLASAITSSASSMTLTSATDKAGNTLASSTYAFVIDSGTSQEEVVIADCTGTACTNMTRGISPLTGTTTVASLQFAHRRGASVKITDAPQLLILSRLTNGIQQFPNLLSYKSGTACSVGSGNGTICDKAYIDGVAVAGASNANETTKGIVEIATDIEGASTTQMGSTGARLVLGTGTSSPSFPQTLSALKAVILNNLGFINPFFISTTSDYRWSGLHYFTSTTSMFAIGIGTSSPYTALGVVGEVVASKFTATSTTATSTFTNLRVSNNATTTNLTISNTCVGCINGYEYLSQAIGNYNGGTPALVSNTLSCSTGKRVLGGGAVLDINSAYLYGSFPASNSSWEVRANANNNGNTSAAGTMYVICAYP